ncbi:hypothetical protein [Pseudomonas oligotrophica]|uniref:hypothetical protein n=1 Tax=Pseudomonas oligotrophica TaxID=2912055 RepID=UPI001F292611|nr:hypothetical protein [Pseudomonas oligotrophica]
MKKPTARRAAGNGQPESGYDDCAIIQGWVGYRLGAAADGQKRTVPQMTKPSAVSFAKLYVFTDYSMLLSSFVHGSGCQYAESIFFEAPIR